MHLVMNKNGCIHEFDYQRVYRLIKLIHITDDDEFKFSIYISHHREKESRSGLRPLT